MSKKDGQKSDSNDNSNNASNNAIWTPKWRYVAMENTGNGVTTEVVMQWVCDQWTNGPKDGQTKLIQSLVRNKRLSLVKLFTNANKSRFY